MTEVLFYHLQAKPLEVVLPELIQRSLERGWRCVVEAASERLRPLDDLLWTYSDDAFIPHGLEEDDGAEQPVVLVDHGGNPNAADIRFLLDAGELPADPARYRRIVVMFDGNDAEALAAARRRWTEAKAAGLEATYWQQDEGGRWRKKA